MDTHSIIKQFTEQLSDSPVEQERISHLAPIEFVLLNLNKDVKIKVDEKHTFLCVPALEKSKGDVSYDDIEYLKITDEKLFELLQQYDQNNINEFIEYLNKEIFKYIQTKVQSAIKKGAWDKTNMWFKPNQKFLEWFDLKAIDLSKSAPLEKQPTIPNSDTQKKPKGGRPKGLTKRTISRYKKVKHQFEILKKKYSSKTKAELYDLMATKDYDTKSYKRNTIRNIIEDKKYNLIPSR
jgi:hypothetical protein